MFALRTFKAHSLIDVALYCVCTEIGDVNPFLHLSLHLAVAEQLAIDQPPGIRAEFDRIRTATGDEHAALHAVLECLGEVLWTAQRHGTPPDAALYLDCLRAR